jgi:hypothetical protein
MTLTEHSSSLASAQFYPLPATQTTSLQSVPFLAYLTTLFTWVSYNASSDRTPEHDGQHAETVLAYIVTEVNHGTKCEKLDTTGAK